VNGPHYALAAKRFHPVRLSTAAHFLNPAQHPLLPPLFHTQHPNSTTIKTTRKVLLATTCDDKLRHYTTTYTTIKEQPLRMTIRSPIGALPRYLPNGFFPVCCLLVFVTAFLRHHVFRKSCISFCQRFLCFAAILATQATQDIPWMPQEPLHRTRSGSTKATFPLFH
jgi:hypothetical protein